MYIKKLKKYILKNLKMYIKSLKEYINLGYIKNSRLSFAKINNNIKK